MSNKKGFTLIELLVVLIIIGLLAIIALPIYFKMVQEGAANAAEHNLITIYNAQKIYSAANSGNYCTTQTGSASCQPATCSGCTGTCGGSLNDINCNLSSTQNLGVNDSYFSYSCSGSTCTATASSTNTTLTVTLTNPIVLPGSSSTLNPSCSSSDNNLCPTG